MSSTDLRAAILRSASASGAELAAYRVQPMPQLLSAIKAFLEKAQEGNSVEYDTTCALRFLSRCMVKSDGDNTSATSAVQQKVEPREDMFYDEYAGIISLFCEHICQTSVGLGAIDGLQRLIQTYTCEWFPGVAPNLVEGRFDVDEEFVFSEMSPNTLVEQDSRHKRDKFDKACENLVVLLFLDFAVQELPTMSRRNALKILTWFTSRPETWTYALRACASKFQASARASSSSSSSKKQNKQKQSEGENSSSAYSLIDVTTYWVSNITGALDEERDPVNVLSLFEVSVNIHRFLAAQHKGKTLTRVARQMISASSSDLNEDGGGNSNNHNNNNNNRRNNNEDEDEDENEQQEEEEGEAQELLEAVEALFQVSAGYFPLQFSPAPGSSVKKEQLIEKLHQVMSLPLYSSFALPLLLHKLSSAASTATMMHCLDVLKRSIASYFGFAPIRCFDPDPSLKANLSRRFLHELFPFFKGYIVSQQQKQQQQQQNQQATIAQGIVEVISEAASLFDSSFHGSTDLRQDLLDSATIRSILSQICASQTSSSSAASSLQNTLLDASMIHALGKKSALFAILLGSQILPLICAVTSSSSSSSSKVSESVRNQMPIVASIFANFEINSSSPSSSLGDPQSGNANHFRSRLHLEEGAIKMLRTCVRNAVDSASSILREATTASSSSSSCCSSNNSSSLLSPEHILRAAADTVASAACCFSRQLGILFDGENDFASCEKSCSASISSLLECWKVVCFPSPSSTSSTKYSREFCNSLSNAVSVCLIVVSSSSSSSSSSTSEEVAYKSFIDFDSMIEKRVQELKQAEQQHQPNQNQNQSQDGASNSSSSLSSSLTMQFLTNACSTMNAIITRAPISQSSFALDIVTSCSLTLRSKMTSSSSSPSSNVQQEVCDRLCLAAITDAVSKATSSDSTHKLDGEGEEEGETGGSENIRKNFLSSLRNHLGGYSRDEIESASASLATFLELLFELGTNKKKNNNNSSGEAQKQQQDEDPVLALFDCFVEGNYSSKQVENLSSQLLLLQSSSQNQQQQQISTGRILACFNASSSYNQHHQEQQQQLDQEQEAKKEEHEHEIILESNQFGTLTSLVQLCSTLRLCAISGRQHLQVQKVADAILSSSSSSTENAQVAEQCLKDVMRPAALSFSNKAKWEVRVTNEIISALLMSTSSSSSSSSSATSSASSSASFSSKSDNDQERALSFATVLVRSLSTSSQKRGDFLKIVKTTHKQVLNILQESKPPAEDSSSSSYSSAFVLSTFDEDCATWFEWLLNFENDDESNNNNNSESQQQQQQKQEDPKLAALDFLLLSEKNRKRFVFRFADIASSSSSQNNNNNMNKDRSLHQRDRALKVLSLIAKTCLTFTLDKHPKAGFFEAALKPHITEINKKLDSCLTDKKRIIRQGAAECKHLLCLVKAEKKN